MTTKSKPKQTETTATTEPVQDPKLAADLEAAQQLAEDAEARATAAEERARAAEARAEDAEATAAQPANFDPGPQTPPAILNAGKFLVSAELGPVARAGVGLFAPGSEYKWPNRATPIGHDGEVRRNEDDTPMEKPSIKLIPVDQRAYDLLVEAWGPKSVTRAHGHGPVPLLVAMDRVDPKSQVGKRKPVGWKAAGTVDQAIPPGKILQEPPKGAVTEPTREADK